MPHAPVRAQDPDLAGVLAVLEKRPPRGVEIQARLEEVVEPAADQLGEDQAEEATGGRIGVDQDARVVDDDHGIGGGGEERLGLRVAEHQARATPTAQARQACTAFPTCGSLMP